MGTVGGGGSSSRYPRFTSDVVLHATKAAYEHQPLRTLLNQLQTNTPCKLSTETRRLAEYVYEEKLLFLVSSTLKVVAEGMSEEDKRSLSTIPDGCSSLYDRFVKVLEKGDRKTLEEMGMAVTTAQQQLLQLSNLWKKRGWIGEKLVKELEGFVLAIAFDEKVGVEGSEKRMKEFMKVRINGDEDGNMSISKTKLKEVLKGWRVENVECKGRNLLMQVDDTVTMEALVLTINRMITWEETVDVIVRSEEEAREVVERCRKEYTFSCQVVDDQGKVEEKDGRPCVIIGSLKGLEKRRWNERKERLECHSMASCLIVSCGEMFIEEREKETVLEEAFLPLEETIASVYVTLEMADLHEEELRMILTHSANRGVNVYKKDMDQLVECWPQPKHHDLANEIFKELCNHGEYQKPYRLLNLFSSRKSEECVKLAINKVENVVGAVRSLVREGLTQGLKRSSSKLLVPHLKAIHDFVGRNADRLLNSAMEAKKLQCGKDYVVQFKRDTPSLSLCILLSPHFVPSLGLQQFLEVKHGCALSPFTIPAHTQKTIGFLKMYQRVVCFVRMSGHTEDEVKKLTMPLNMTVHSRIATKQKNDGKEEKETSMRTSVEEREVSTKKEKWIKEVESTVDKEEKSSKAVLIVCPSLDLVDELCPLLAPISIVHSECAVEDALQKGINRLITTQAHFLVWERNPVKSSMAVILGVHYVDPLILRRSFRFARPAGNVVHFPFKDKSSNPPSFMPKRERSTIGMKRSMDGKVINSSTMIERRVSTNGDGDCKRDFIYDRESLMENRLLEVIGYAMGMDDHERVVNALIHDFALWKDGGRTVDFDYMRSHHVTVDVWMKDSVHALRLAGMKMKEATRKKERDNEKLIYEAGTILAHLSGPEAFYYKGMLALLDNGVNAKTAVRSILSAKNELAIRVKALSALSRKVSVVRDTNGVPQDIRCDGFVEQMRTRMYYVAELLASMDDVVSETMKECPSIVHIINDQTDTIHSIASDYNVDRHKLHSDLLWRSRDMKSERIEVVGATGAEDMWTWLNLDNQRGMVFALDDDALSDATSCLQYMEKITLRPDWQKKYVQHSLRHLNGLTFYGCAHSHFTALSAYLTNLPGASTESLSRVDMNKIAKLNFSLPEDALNAHEVLVRCIGEKSERLLLLLPRNVQESIWRDLHMHGIIVSDAVKTEEELVYLSDDEEGDAQMKPRCEFRPTEVSWIMGPCDCEKTETPEATLSLSVIMISNKSRSVESAVHKELLLTPPYESPPSRDFSWARLLSIEGACMVVGSSEWMRWLARRMILDTEYFKEGIKYYERSMSWNGVMEGTNVKGKMVYDALNSTKLKSSEEMRKDIHQLDQFSNSVVGDLSRGMRLVSISPSLSSIQTARKLSDFIRRRTLPSL